jgi:hypothetical protein
MVSHPLDITSFTCFMVFHICVYFDTRSPNSDARSTHVPVRVLSFTNVSPFVPYFIIFLLSFYTYFTLCCEIFLSSQYNLVCHTDIQLKIEDTMVFPHAVSHYRLQSVVWNLTYFPIKPSAIFSILQHTFWGDFTEMLLAPVWLDTSNSTDEKTDM